MNHESVKLAGEVVSLGIVVGTLVKVLPAIAALASIIWYGILFYDRWKKKE